MINPEIHSQGYPNSYYFVTLKYKLQYPSLEGKLATQVCAIGGEETRRIDV